MDQENVVLRSYEWSTQAGKRDWESFQESQSYGSQDSSLLGKKPCIMETPLLPDIERRAISIASLCSYDPTVNLGSALASQCLSAGYGQGNIPSTLNHCNPNQMNLQSSASLDVYPEVIPGNHTYSIGADHFDPGGPFTTSTLPMPPDIEHISLPGPIESWDQLGRNINGPYPFDSLPVQPNDYFQTVGLVFGQTEKLYGVEDRFFDGQQSQDRERMHIEYDTCFGPAQTESDCSNPSPAQPNSCSQRVGSVLSQTEAVSTGDGSIDGHPPTDTERMHVEYDTCFGMIQLKAAKLSADIAQKELAVEVSLKFRGSLVTIHHQDSKKYAGLVDHDTGQVLGQLERAYSVTFTAFLGAKPATSSKKPEVADPPKLQIVVYGLQGDGDSIGTLLSEKNLYLQHPQIYDSSVPYANPHYLVRPGCNIHIPENCDPQTNANSVRRNQMSDEVTKNQLQQVLDTAQGPQIYSEVEASSQLLTALKSHQKKALAMMVEKECGILEGSQFDTLWDCKAFYGGEKMSYRNRITGATRKTYPPLSLGGLLADEMGLGKTLTTLALIARSLDERTCSPSDNVGTSISAEQAFSSYTTLIIAPKSTISAWDQQIERHLKPNSLKVYVYHGPKRKAKASELLEYDIVITTYDTLVTEWASSSRRSDCQAKILHSCEWFRIILDEAHVIRDRSSARHRAVCELRARHRWCLTGTPIQNRVDDYGALLSFLGVSPFDVKSHFDNHIANPIKARREEGLKKLKSLVQATSLRRTKASVFGELQLNPRINRVHPVVLNEGERQIYNFFKRRAVGIITNSSFTDGNAGTVGSIFPTILKLRQICNDGLGLLSAAALRSLETEDSDQNDFQAILRQSELCEKCNADLRDMGPVETAPYEQPCLHLICAKCMLESQGDDNSADKNACPLCSKNSSTPLNDHTSERSADDASDTNEKYQPSSKILALLQNLHADRVDSVQKPIKSVIFTVWAKMLDRIGKALTLEGFVFERIDGDKSLAQRSEALRNFYDNPKCTIMLATVGSAGVGLDLTVASRVHLIEPQWNPMAEEQALDRVHRMGQTREVIAIRYIVKDSIEEYVQQIQRDKLNLIQQSLDADIPNQTDIDKDRWKGLKTALQ